MNFPLQGTVWATAWTQHPLTQPCGKTVRAAKISNKMIHPRYVMVGQLSYVDTRLVATLTYTPYEPNRRSTTKGRLSLSDSALGAAEFTGSSPPPPTAMKTEGFGQTSRGTRVEACQVLHQADRISHRLYWRFRGSSGQDTVEDCEEGCQVGSCGDDIAKVLATEYRSDCTK